MKIKYLITAAIAVLALSGISSAYADVFTQNLYYGLQNNAQVTQLQEFLASQGLYSGPITGNFYFLTMNAVKAFQAQQGIAPAAGYFGPLTMTAANKLADVAVNASNNEAISETGTSTPSVQASSTAELQLKALLKAVALLEQQLAARQSSTQEVQSQMQSQTQAIQQQTQTLQQIAQNTQPAAPASTTAPSSQDNRPFTVNEEAEVNFGSGLMRAVDVNANNPYASNPSITPRQIIEGKMDFICIYDSHEQGLPDFCTPPDGSTSTLPQFSSVPLTMKIEENSYICANGIPTANQTEETETVQTDAAGNFSFTAPGGANLQDYVVNVYNGSQFINGFGFHNSSALPASAVCQAPD